MSSSKKRSERARRGTRADRPSPIRPGQDGIPSDARYVNVTTLDDDVLERLCRIEQGHVMRNVLVGLGAAAILFAVAVFALLHADLVISVVIAAVGALLVWQGMHLARRTAIRTGRELDRAGADGRRRMAFFTATELGTVDADGSVHTLPYAAIERVEQDDRIFALRMSDGGGLMALAKSGFTHGSAEDFAASIEHRVAEARRQMTGQLRHGRRKDPSARR